MKRPKAKYLTRLLYWMEERQSIYRLRCSGSPAPWTFDPVLAKYRFCNVYREQDQVTEWIRNNWREPYREHSNLWFSMAIARLINWPGTLQEIGFPEEWKPDSVVATMEARKKRGEKVYTSAYMLPSGREKSKPRFTVYRVLQPLWEAAQKAPPVWLSLQSSFEYLNSFYGFGKFLSYEVVTDLRWTRYLGQANDIYTWANLGPGAQRGLNRMYERELKSTQPQPQLLEELLTVQDWIAQNRSVKLLPNIESRDVEHCLCEFDKFLRAEERMKEGKTIGLEVFRNGNRLV